MATLLAVNVLTFQDKEIGVVLQWQVVTPANVVQDLTGATGTLIAKGNPNSPFPLTFPSPSAGIAQYVTEASKWRAGTYPSQLQLVMGSQVLYSRVATIRVDRALA
jgi:hypothetical protein